jgi:hypothetical protein
LRGLGSTLPEASYSFCEGDEKMSQNWLWLLIVQSAVHSCPGNSHFCIWILASEL